LKFNFFCMQKYWKLAILVLRALFHNFSFSLSPIQETWPPTTVSLWRHFPAYANSVPYFYNFAPFKKICGNLHRSRFSHWTLIKDYAREYFFFLRTQDRNEIQTSLAIMKSRKQIWIIGNLLNLRAPLVFPPRYIKTKDTYVHARILILLELKIKNMNKISQFFSRGNSQKAESEENSWGSDGRLLNFSLSGQWNTFTCALCWNSINECLW
jgi:hypothetical protein